MKLYRIMVFAMRANTTYNRPGNTVVAPERAILK